MLERYPRSLRQRIVVLVIGNLALLVLIAAMMKEGSSFGGMLRQAVSDVAPVTLAALGMAGVIYCGAIDLSIASIVAVAGTAFGAAVARGAPAWGAHALCFAVAASLCALNGALVRALKIPAIIVTLAAMPFYRGAALILAELAVPKFGGYIAVGGSGYDAPGKLYAAPILLAALAGALAWEASAKTPRQWLALGGSEEALRLAGVSPARTLQGAYLASGFFLGLASIILVTRVQAIEPARIARGLELDVIGAVALGGTNIFGGEGSYAGAALGALFLYLTALALTYAGVSPYYQDAIAGALIIAVIGIDCALHRKRKMIEELA